MHHSFNIRTFEMYLVFTICALGTLLSTCSGFDLDLFNEKMLKLHNDHRCKHGAGNLTFDNELSKFAKDDEVLNFLATDGRWTCYENVRFLLYRTKNIADLTTENVFYSWYNENQNYNYREEPNNENAEHFTQIVWKTTQSVGFVMVPRNDEYWFVAAYHPAGNQIKKYINNVQELIKESD